MPLFKPSPHLIPQPRNESQQLLRLPGTDHTAPVIFDDIPFAPAGIEIVRATPPLRDISQLLQAAVGGGNLSS